jgi:hypothetical protein
VSRLRSWEVEDVALGEILHAERFGNFCAESLRNRPARLLAVDRSEHVEIPVVVVPERAGRVAAARRPPVLAAIDGGVVDA